MLFICTKQSCWACLPCCRGDLPSLVHVLFLLRSLLWVTYLYRLCVLESKAWAAWGLAGVCGGFASLLTPGLSWCSGLSGFSGILPWMQPLYFCSFARELVPAWVPCSPQHSCLLPSGVAALFPATSSGDLLGHGDFPQGVLWCRACFCGNYCFSLSLMLRSAPWAEKCG